MKSFKNQITTITFDESNTVFRYTDMIALCINAPNKNTLTISQIRDRIQILDKLEKVKTKENFDLSDKEIKIIKEVELAMDGNWAVPHPDILAFSDYIRAL